MILSDPNLCFRVSIFFNVKYSKMVHVRAYNGKLVRRVMARVS